MEMIYENERILIKDGNTDVGYVKYVKMNDNVIDVVSTFVNEDYRGQGIAGKLFKELVCFVRAHHYQMIPSCSYIKKRLENSTEYQDIYYKK